MKQGREYGGFIADLRPYGLKRITSASFDRLKGKVDEALALVDGNLESKTLRKSELRAYERAVQIAASMGSQLDQAVLEYQQLKQRARKANCDPVEAIAYWEKHHNTDRLNAPLSEAVAAFLDFLERKNGNSPEDIAGVRSKLTRFAKSFESPLVSISGSEYQQYLSLLKSGARDQKNHRDEICRFINWAKIWGYLPTDHPGIRFYGSRTRRVAKSIAVLDRDRRERLLDHALAHELPMALIKCFIPIRQKEISLINWQDINLEDGTLVIDPAKAKVRRGRVMRLPRELSERLRPFSKPSGPIFTGKSPYKAFPRMARRAGIAWSKNILRATVISHLQAAINHKQLVAEEAGTSVGRLDINYLKLGIPSKVGRSYFGLREGEMHPIEPGYNALRPVAYKFETEVSAQEDPSNVVVCDFRRYVRGTFVETPEAKFSGTMENHSLAADSVTHFR